MRVSDFVKNKEDLDFLEEIRLALSDNYLNEVHLVYKEKYLAIEPINSKIVVFFEGEEHVFDNVDEVFFNFVLDGKSFIERVAEIDYE